MVIVVPWFIPLKCTYVHYIKQIKMIEKSKNKWAGYTRKNAKDPKTWVNLKNTDKE